VKLLKQRKKPLKMSLIKHRVNIGNSFFLCIFSFNLEQGEKLKRQASETGEKIKSAANNAKKQVEKQTDGLGDKLFSILIDVKNSIFGKL
jgi:hypothetical protein